MKYFSINVTAQFQSLVTRVAVTAMAGLDLHRQELKKHCRVCASVLGSKGYYSCTEAKNKVLLQKLGVDVRSDCPDVHPQSFCHTCRTKATQISEHVDSSLVLFQWQPHTPSCSVCCHFQKQKKGGRPKKMRKNRGRPSLHSAKAITNRVLRTTLPSHKTSSPLSLSRFLPSTVALESLQCGVCHNSANAHRMQKAGVCNLHT